MSQLRTFAIVWLTLCFLSSCSYWNSNNTKRVVCNKLKSDLVFNGAGPNSRESDIERAEQPLQQHTYDANDCADS